MMVEHEAITEGEWKSLATTETTHLTDEEKGYLPRAWDEWIARVRRDAWEECAAMAAHHGAFDGSRARWLSSINPSSTTEKEKEA